MTAGLLLPLAGAAAFLLAIDAWRADRRLNRPIARRPAPLLARIGAQVIRLTSRPAWTPPWAVRGDAAIRAAAAASLAADQVAAMRAGAVVAFAGVGVAAALLLGGSMGIVLGLPIALFGIAYTDLHLRAADTRRRERIEREAPAVLDLIAVSVAAGIPVDEAIRACAPAATGPLAAELRLALANIELGRPRRLELRDLASRTGSPSLGGLALAVSLADRLGVAPAEHLRRQARRARAERARVVQERAAAAAPKVLVVVVFVLVPAALLPVLAAVGLSVSGALMHL